MFARAVILLLLCAANFAANPEAPKVILEQGANHWAFQPVKRPAIGRGHPIDFLVRQQLERHGLSPSPEASRAILIRRLSLDLIGLPPAPEEVVAFVNDRDPRAYENLIDRLLASPHYGERWARHWLDAVRFAESNGFETNTPRKNAWPYRDYIIRALNSDLPYDRFVLEQLAGDALGADAATGYLVGGPWDEVKSPDPNLTAQQRMDELHDMVATTGSTFLGLTIGCARCHNHKFDPISQVDYYAMQAIFAGVRHGERALPAPNASDRQRDIAALRAEISKLDSEIASAEPLANPGGAVRRAPVNARLNLERFAPVRAHRVRFTVTATNGGEPCLDELEVFDETGHNVALGAKPTASGTYPNSEIHRLEHINDGKYGNSRSWISSEQGRGWVELQFAEAVTISKVVWARDREEKFADRLATVYRLEVSENESAWKLVADSTDRAALGSKIETSPLATARREKEERLRSLTRAPMVYAGTFEQPGPTHRLQRGEPLQKREPLAPAMPVRFAKDAELSSDLPEQQRRLALAKWIVDPANPLSARVMANRVWQFHFGAGLVETPSDLGLNGGRPSNPELLDWLAAEFVASGWSLKRLHRIILTSATYRQSSQPREEALQRDAANRLLWRYAPHRLEAEALRDSMLQVCGNLDLRMGGVGFDLFEPNDNYVRVFAPRKEFGAAEARRMIYLTKHRMQLDDTFGAFDCPDAGQIAPRRTTSTTPLQALSLLNSPFVQHQSELFAARLQNEGRSTATQSRRAFWLAFAREPDAAELAAAESFVRAEGLPAFCRSLLNANEFLYLF